MESITEYILEMDDFEDDILYQLGKMKGEAGWKWDAVKKLLVGNRCTVAEIAYYVGVTEVLVETVKKTLEYGTSLRS